MTHNTSQRAVLCYAVKHSKSFTADRIVFTFTSVKKVSNTFWVFWGFLQRLTAIYLFSKEGAFLCDWNIKLGRKLWYMKQLLCKEETVQRLSWRNKQTKQEHLIKKQQQKAFTGTVWRDDTSLNSSALCGESPVYSEKHKRVRWGETGEGKQTVAGFNHTWQTVTK